jgi:hypothetical protein
VAILPPDLPPELQTIVNLSGIGEQDEHVVGLLHNHMEAIAPKPPTTKQVKLRHEADAFYAVHKAKGHRGHFQVRQAIDLLFDITGDVFVHEVSADHWRQLKSKIETRPGWGKIAQHFIQRINREFLSQVAIDHEQHEPPPRFGFLKNKMYMIRRPRDGKKEQYTDEQVRTAL